MKKTFANKMAEELKFFNENIARYKNLKTFAAGVNEIDHQEEEGSVRMEQEQSVLEVEETGQPEERCSGVIMDHQSASNVEEIAQPDTGCREQSESDEIQKENETTLKHKLGLWVLRNKVPTTKLMIFSKL